MWELKALTNHWYVRVSDRAKFIHGNKPEQRIPITSDDTLKTMDRKFNEEASTRLGAILSGGRLKATEDLLAD